LGFVLLIYEISKPKSKNLNSLLSGIPVKWNNTVSSLVELIDGLKPKYLKANFHRKTILDNNFVNSLGSQ